MLPNNNTTLKEIEMKSTRIEMVTVKEVAKEFGVGDATIRRWIANGTIRAVKIGKLLRINREDLELLKDNGVVFSKHGQQDQ